MPGSTIAGTHTDPSTLSRCRAAPVAGPAGDTAVLANHAEVVMHDLAAGLLLELERLMLTSSPASVNMASYLDTAPDFQAPAAASALEAVQNRLYKDEVPRCGLLRDSASRLTLGHNVGLE